MINSKNSIYSVNDRKKEGNARDQMRKHYLLLKKMEKRKISDRSCGLDEDLDYVCESEREKERERRNRRNERDEKKERRKEIEMKG